MLLENVVSWKVITVPLMFIILFASIYLITKQNMGHLKDQIIEQMELQGGYTSLIESDIKTFCDAKKMNYANLSINATPAVQNYGTDLNLNITYTYTTNWLFNHQVFTISETGSIKSEVLVR